MKTTVIAFFAGCLGAWFFQILNSHFWVENFAHAANETIIKASRFELIGSDGKIRAQLGFAKEGPPGFWIMDEKGVPRVTIGLYPDGTSHIGLQDQSGKMIQLLRSFGPAESPLHIFKNNDQDRMILGLNSSKRDPFFITYNKSLKKKIHLDLDDGP
ncbi:MAG: hypothetical protein K1X29_08525 [Bdellovibrionales bacterium]|nr:hypothetical protein [Bdellovibrionales bacterium]